MDILSGHSDMKSKKMQTFEKGLRDMFSSIWDCRIEQEVFEDTVGDLMKAVVMLAENTFKGEVSTIDDTALRKVIVDKVYDAEKRRFEARNELDVGTMAYCGGEIDGYMNIIRLMDEMVDGGAE